MKKYLIFWATLLVANCAIAQKTVYFPGFELINLSNAEGLEYSTSKLIKAYIEDNHDFTIVVDDRVGREGYDVRSAVANSSGKAKELDTRYKMLGEIHFLQGVFIVSIGLYETQTEQQVWHDMVKGSSEDDLDPLLSRLGRTFSTNKTAKTDINIDEVTEYDEQGVELAQIKVNHFVGVMLGGKQIPDENVLSGFGILYTYDASTFLFNFDFEFYPSANLIIDQSVSERRLQTGNVGLGVTYPFSRKRNTFYINGGMEYGYGRVKDFYFDEEYTVARSGIGAGFGAGFLINRNSSVNLRIFAAVSAPFYSVDDTKLTGLKFGIVTSFAR